MTDSFHRHVWLARANAYAKRTEECLRLAEVCPKVLRDGYLELATQYEKLAQKGEDYGP